MLILNNRILAMMKRQISRNDEEQILGVPFEGIISYNMISQIGIFRTWSLRSSFVLSNQCNQFLCVTDRAIAFIISTYVGVCFH
jgi:hypothetical protein